jgi:hypothetical protein
MTKLDEIDMKTSYFATGGGGFMPEEDELKERDILIAKARKGNKKAKLALMSPPYSLSCLVKDGKKII